MSDVSGCKWPKWKPAALRAKKALLAAVALSLVLCTVEL